MAYTISFLLLIDDDQDDLDIMLSSFLDLGFTVKCFTSGADAMRYLENLDLGSRFPDMIVLDYNMPINNGHSILVRLKANMALKDIPVVIYSTTLSTPVRRELMENGALDCLIKPSSWNMHNHNVEEICSLIHPLERKRSY